uniref:Fibronectin type-III domain-containing protein n=1 Tax=Heterosigma akashiwo TaxID=2829 RepID=A0A7S3UTI5_HETAK
MVILRQQDLPYLYPNGPLVYHLSGLDEGVYYYVRATILSDVGMSNETQAKNQPMATQQISEPPTDVSLLTATTHDDEEITNLTVSWLPPTSDGGTEIIGYRVELWETQALTYEVQQIDLGWPASSPPDSGATWNFAFRGVTSFGLKQDVSTINLRDALMNLNNETDFPIGYVDVNRTGDGSTGYTYLVTFMDDSRNARDEPLLQVDNTFDDDDRTTTSSEITSGVRPEGANEIQVIESYGTGSGQRGSFNPDDSIIRGWWRIKFDGSAFTIYLSSEASAADVEGALETLETVGDVSVTREDGTMEDGNGYRWIVTFITPVGNLDPLEVDVTFLWTTNSDAGILVSDGDNDVDQFGSFSCPACQVGETAVGYVYADTDADERDYTFEGLTTGTEYTAAVSAITKFGQGQRAYGAGSGRTYTLPLFEPSLPTEVSSSVKTWSDEEGDDGGDNERLIVTYAPPYSTGGSQIVHYRVELDVDLWFENPVAETFQCPGTPEYAVWTVETGATTTNGTINGGYFELTLTRNGQELTTDPIPFNAVALSKEEKPADLITNSTVHCTYEDGDNRDYCPTFRVQSSGSMQSKVNALSTLTNGVDVSRREIGQGRYTWSLTFLDLEDDFDLSAGDSAQYLSLKGPGTQSNATSAEVKVRKFQAGLVHDECHGDMVVPTDGGLEQGQDYYARVFAYNRVGFGEPQVATDPSKPTVVPSAPDNVYLEVSDADALLVTVYDPLDDGGDDITMFTIEYSLNSTFNQSQFDNITGLDGGEPYYKVISGLENGRTYYFRVYAHNSQGQGPYKKSDPEFEHPYEEPGQPTNLVYKTTSNNELTLGWDPPSSDGGDDILYYIVQFSTSSSFSSFLCEGDDSDIDGAKVLPYHTYYTCQTSSGTVYARVKASNSMGDGLTKTPSPNYAAPSTQVPGKPSDVTLVASGAVSGNYSVAVSWNSPVVPYHGYPCYGNDTNPGDCPYTGIANGGLTISSYTIQYSHNNTFAVPPIYTLGNLDGSSTTITNFTDLNLTESIYFRIRATNSKGDGSYCTETGIGCSSGTLLSVDF